MESLNIYTSIYTLYLKFIFLYYYYHLIVITVITAKVMTMGGNKSRDGIKLSQVVRMLEELPGVKIRDGSKHAFIAQRANQRPCPIAASTDVKRMVVPWIEEATGMHRDDIYTSLRGGEWYRN